MTLNLHKDGIVLSKHGYGLSNGGLGACHLLSHCSVGSREIC